MHILYLNTEYDSYYKTFNSEAEMYQYLMEHNFTLQRLHGEALKGLPTVKERTIRFENGEGKAFIMASIPAGASYLAIK